MPSTHTSLPKGWANHLSKPILQPSPGLTPTFTPYRETAKLLLVLSHPQPPKTQEGWVQFLGPEDPLEEEMATHSSIVAWKIPWTLGPGRL